MAVSVVAWENFPFEAAARYAARLAEKVLQDGLPSRVVLNVNVPSKAAQGIRVTRQGPCNVRSLIVEKSDPRGRKYFWLDQQLDPATLPGESDFDYIAVESGFVSLTPLKLDRTDLDAASQLAAWPEALSGEKSV